MTTNIVITDDHKTAALSRMPQSERNSLFDGVGQIEEAVCMPGFPGPTFHRNAYSTTDLQNMQQQSCNPHMDSFALSQSRSRFTPAAPSSKPLSRPASPPGRPEPQNKKRKAGFSSKVPPSLTMTKLQDINAPIGQTPAVLSATQHRSFENGWCNGPSLYEGNNHLSHGLPEASYQTNAQSTSSPSESNFQAVGSRATSVENLQGQPGNCSAPTSMPASRVPSPPSTAQWNAVNQGSAQNLVNSLASLSTAGPQMQSPIIHIITPKEGSRSGGTEVTLLGKGFHEGLQVMFGEIQATRTTCWSDTALHCLSPPAQHADIVCVTLRNIYHQTAVMPSSQTATFKYINDDEERLMKQALSLISRQYHGQNADTAVTARNVIQHLDPKSSFVHGSNQGNYGQRQMSGNSPAVDGAVSLEAAVLICLELVDLDDSPYQANLNAQDVNGQSLLHLSASLGLYRLTAALLARGAMPDLRDRNGLSPLHTASLRGNQHIIRKLRSAGGDPTMRTLNGHTPADMASSQSVRNVIDALGSHSRSRSAGTTPTASLSRASSVMSSHPNGGSYIFAMGADETMDSMYSRAIQIYDNQPVTPTETYPRSRRTSLSVEQTFQNDEPQPDIVPSASLFAANRAMSAWVDQISAQIQQFQQSVHRTLPNIQIPTLPPIPIIPDYQAYPVVRRISSLVPQMNPRPGASSPSSRSTKEGDPSWWDFITGSVSSPPAYEEIYPASEGCETENKKTSILFAKGEAFVDQKCEAIYDQARVPSMTTTDSNNSLGTKAQNDALQDSSRAEVKRLRSDRKLFLIWVSNSSYRNLMSSSDLIQIPLLVLVLIATLKDRVPQAVHAIHRAFDLIQGHNKYPVIET